MCSPQRSGPTALHFGAGNIGRGFIGPVLVDAGYNVIFADINKDIINAIHEHGYYDVHVLDDKELGKPVEKISVSHIDGVLSTSPEMIDKIADEADLITTAVGPSVLSKIAPVLAKGLERRASKEARTNLNIIACENTVNATTQLKNLILDCLSPSFSRRQVQEYIEGHVGFANCSVDRIVPPKNMGDPSSSKEVHLDVAVETYHEWVIEEPALKKPLPLPLPAAKMTSDLAAYVERKIFTLNTGHALTAYLGFLHNPDITIDTAIAYPGISKVVRGAMEESGAALQIKHHFSEKDHARYIHDIIGRFKNPNLKDKVKRVGRSPLRKLGRGDRLLGPIGMCREYGLGRANLLVGVAAALRYDNSEDDESVRLQKMVRERGVEEVVEELVGSEDKDAVLKSYMELGRVPFAQSYM